MSNSTNLIVAFHGCNKFANIADPKSTLQTDQVQPKEEFNTDRTRRVKLAVWILFLVYVVRVTLQVVQVVFELDGPIPLSTWDSGLVSYPILLTAQSLVGALLIWVIFLVDGKHRPRTGNCLQIIGSIYLAAMLFRSAAAQFSFSRTDWTDAPVSTSVHIVMACIVLIVGSELAPSLRRSSFLRLIFRKSFYPLILGASVLLFSWSLEAGLLPAVSAYLALAFATVAIIVAELLMPFRSSWQPDKNSIFVDILYLGLVQAALPALAGALVVYLTGRFEFSPMTLWPNKLPVPMQVILMILIADFGRYWLHRSSHAWPILWRLHAVHHAPEDLHALNVGRFHPIEKAMQFAFDTVPFILLGVSDTVIAGYLVFYAVNGFFQHSNIDLSLGALNHVISGPELHRWHHARDPELSDHNFGNNLIVWDSFFGTRLLPENAEVQELGLRNPNYPTDIAGQMVAPFNLNPNAGDTQ